MEVEDDFDGFYDEGDINNGVEELEGEYEEE